MITNKTHWKVGDLAKQTGLTVRMLHYYDKIRLLSPSMHSDTDHRIYTEEDVKKLQQIISLKELGFTLDAIKGFIENPDFNPVEIIRLHLESVKEQIRRQERLCSRLEEIYERINGKQDVKAEQFIKLIEVINVKDEFFTKDQLDKMKKQFEKLSPEKRIEHKNEWVDLMEKVRIEFEKGTPPENLEIKDLTKRWNEFINLLSGGDPEISEIVERYYKENPDKGSFKIDKQFIEYIQKAHSNS